MAGTFVWGKLLGSRSEIVWEQVSVTVDRVDGSRVSLRLRGGKFSAKAEDGFLLSENGRDDTPANRTKFSVIILC